MRPHPGRDRGAARRGHALQLREIRDRQYPRHDRHLDAGGAGAVAEAQEHIDVEKELRDRAAGAGVELRLQIIEIVAGAAGRRMGFGIGRDADLEIGDLFQSCDQIGRVGIASRVGRIAEPGAARYWSIWRDRRAAPRCDGFLLPSRHGRRLRPLRASPRRRSGAPPVPARFRRGCAAPSRACARGSSRRLRMSPRRSAAAAAPGA